VFTSALHSSSPIMPPRKSLDMSKGATGDEGTPVKDALVREGINIEVYDLRLIFAQ
jgi:hypothetical protein